MDLWLDFLFFLELLPSKIIDTGFFVLRIGRWRWCSNPLLFLLFSLVLLLLYRWWGFWSLHFLKDLIGRFRLIFILVIPSLTLFLMLFLLISEVKVRLLMFPLLWRRRWDFLLIEILRLFNSFFRFSKQPSTWLHLLLIGSFFFGRLLLTLKFFELRRVMNWPFWLLWWFGLFLR